MTLLSGARLGPYEILAPLGQGGMGEVYKARDTRLDRTVAIKILSEALAADSQFRERFEREARTISSLDHPHICALYDVGGQNGTSFLVMQYLDGETLADRLKKGALPLDQALRIAIEIADALDKAHRAGITHRDLKPGNVMLTKSGSKLLDFGLAKLHAPGSSGPLVGLSALPTEQNITAHGTILGTLQYMAPEQLEGKEADGRTDIFAFGAVVYEMVTGKKAFEGKSQASLIGAIMSAEPAPIASLQPMTPPALNHLVKRCLAKVPDERWQSANDLTDQLKWISESGPQVGATIAAASPARKNWLKRLLWATASLVAFAVVGIAVWILKPASPTPVTRFAMSLPSSQRLDLTRPALALSPDGTRLAYAASSITGDLQLYLRMMDSLESRPIPGTEGGRNPFFSPDGQWLGFSAGGKLKKVSVSGGASVDLSDFNVASGVYGASWSSQGIIAFAPNASGPLQRVSDTGGASQPLTRLEKGEIGHRGPEFLPGGKAVLFTTTAGQIAVQAVGGERQNLIPASALITRYVPAGFLVYAQTRNLMAVRFDAQRLAVGGAAVPVVEGVLPLQYSLSGTGSLVYVPGAFQAPQLKLAWVDRKGAEQPVAAPAHNYRFPRISPDAQRVAVEIDEAESQIWLYNLARDTLTRLTFEGNSNINPVWTPDGKRITFKSNPRLLWQSADGSGGAEALTTSELSPNNVTGSWSPDGQTLAFTQDIAGTRNIWILQLKDRKPRSFVTTPLYETAPCFSPDGHWLAYASRESGRFEIYVRPYPGPGGKWQISADGGTEPVWNPKGRELFYRNGNKMMVVDFTAQPTFSVGKPKLLFEGPYVPTPLTLPDYDISPDGERFLMIKESEQAPAPTQINVVLNWFEELKRRVPAK